jgi:hypothetical protein
MGEHCQTSKDADSPHHAVSANSPGHGPLRGRRNLVDDKFDPERTFDFEGLPIEEEERITVLLFNEFVMCQMPRLERHEPKRRQTDALMIE